MSFISRLFLIPRNNMSYKTNILPGKKKRKLFSRSYPFTLRFVEKELCLVFFCLSTKHLLCCLNNCRAKLAKTLTIQKWIDEHCSITKLPFALPVLYGQSIKSGYNIQWKITYNQNYKENKSVHYAFFQSR